MRDVPVVVLAESDETYRAGIRGALRQNGFRVVETSLGAVALCAVQHAADLVIVAPAAGDQDAAIDAAIAVRASRAELPIILLAEQGSERLAISALRARLDDYLNKPCGVADVAAAAAQRLRETRQRPAAAPAPASDLRPIVGESAGVRSVLAHITRVAARDTTVIITGETGTGKELAAALIHSLSARAPRRLVSINCAAIPEGLLESELFGYERGAFTGAAGARAGHFQLADGGTVLFDEIGDMGLLGQAKILRAIECKEVYRLGGHRAIPVDVRVVAATNHDLERRVDEGAFRKDLYYRLNVARIHLPPLRERRDDIPLLLRHYIGEMNRLHGRHIEGFTAEALDRLMDYDWPGNIRELRNLVEGVFVTLDASQIALADLPHPLGHPAASGAGKDGERERLVSALFATNWNKSRTAEKLHWSRMTVYRKMAKYRLMGPPDAVAAGEPGAQERDYHTTDDL
jgi:DNA-binding NtrC family response regulator